MNKKFLTLITAFFILFSIIPSFNLTKAEDYRMSVISIKVFDGADRLAGMKKGALKSEITVKNQGGAITPLIISMVCRGEGDYYQTVDTDIIENISFDENESKTVYAENNCEYDEEVFLKVMVFDNKTDLKLIAEQAVFPSENELNLTSIRIDGNEINGFNPLKYEYELTLPFGSEFPSVFEADPYNESVHTVIEEPHEYGGVLKITVKADGIGEKIYKIIINEAPDPTIPRVSDVIRNGGDASDKVVPLVINETSRYSDLSDEIFTDFGGYTFEENSYYIQPAYEDYADENYKDKNHEWLTFSINKSANIYVVTYISVTANWLPWITSDGYMAVGNDFSEISPASPSENKHFITNYSRVTTTNARSRAYLYKKKISASADSLKTIVMKGEGLGDNRYGSYGVIVEFIDEKEPPLKNLSSKASELNLINPVETDTTARYSDMPNETFTSFGGLEFSSDSWYIQPKFDDGRDSNPASASYRANGEEWISFDIESSADIYVMHFVSVSGNWFSWLKTEGFQPLGKNLEPITYNELSEANAAIATNKSTSSFGGRTKAYIFKKRITVEEGGSETVTLYSSGLLTSSYVSYGIYGVIVDFSANEAPGKASSLLFPASILKAQAEEPVVSEINTAFKNGDMHLDGKSSLTESMITVVVEKVGDASERDLSKAIYINSVPTDSEGDFSAVFPMYDLKGKFLASSAGQTAETSYNPTGDAEIRSFSIGNTKGTVSSGNISLTLPYGTDLRGLIAKFAIHEDAAVYVGDVLQQSGITQNDFSDAVTYTVIADDGTEKNYKVSVTVSPKKESGVNSGSSGSGGGVKNAGKSVNITPSADNKKEEAEEIIPVNTFSDVPQSHWAFDAIEKLYSGGIVSGYSDGAFKPSESLTREQAAKIFVNAFYLVPQELEMSFDDVLQNDWYYYYINVAYGNKVMNGISETLFGVGASISRQDVCVVLARIIDSKKLKLKKQAEEEFADADEISQYAVNGVSKMNSYGFITGYPDNTFRPSANISRAEFCVLLERIMTKINN